MSGVEFEITEEDLKFYEKMGVPAPTLCPEEQQRKRLAFQNMYKLYNGECAATGQKMITDYAPETDMIIYKPEYWWSDQWDFRDFGRDFDFSKTFVENFKALLHSTPVPALTTEYTKDENSDFTNYAGSNKNCYLIFHADMNRDCYFGTGVKKCESCLDNLMIFRSELLFECTDCRNSYDLKFSSDCENCSQSWFLKNCIGCKNCFGCINLRQKEYFLFNKFVGKEKFEAFVGDLDSGHRASMQKLKQQFLDFQKTQIHPHTQGYQNENVSGDHIFRSRNCHQCFDVQESRDMKFCSRIYNGPNVDCYDVDQFGMKIELVYEGSAVGTNSQNVIAAHESYGVTDASYVYNVFHSQNVFGCVGVQRGKYCILNKPYEEKAYFELRDKIISHMKDTGEWGQFFPIEISPFSYNETVASEYFSLTKEEVLKRGWKWRDDSHETKYTGPKVDIPDFIGDVSDDILKDILTCGGCDKNYRIVKPELEFYRKMNLPIPHKCPNCRHADRMALRNPRKLFNRKCDKCSDDIQTTFSPERPEKVYCEKCYLNVVD